MAKNSTLKGLQRLHCNFVGDNGEFLTEPVSDLKDIKFSNEQLKLIRWAITLAMSTNIISDEAKLYIKYSSSSVNDIFNRVRKTKRFDPDGTMTFSALNSKIYRDTVKLENILGDNFWDDLIGNKGNLSEYFIKISKVFAQASGGSKIRDLIILDIPSRSLATECTREKLDELIEIIRPYLKFQMEAIVDALDPQAVGYFNFLINSPPEMLPIQHRKDRNHLIYSLTGEITDEQAHDEELTSTRIVFSDDGNETDAEIMEWQDKDSLSGGTKDITEVSEETSKKEIKSRKKRNPKKQENPHEEPVKIVDATIGGLVNSTKDSENYTSDDLDGFDNDTSNWGLPDLDNGIIGDNSKDVAHGMEGTDIFNLGRPTIQQKK